MKIKVLFTLSLINYQVFAAQQEPTVDYMKSIVPQVITMSAVTASAITDKTLLYPVDNTIILRQSTGKTITTIIADTYKAEGLKGFYKGMPLQVAAVLPANLTLYGSYGISKRFFKDNGVNDRVAEFLAGGLAGFALSIVTCPAEGERTRAALNIKLTGQQKRMPSYLFKGFAPSVAKGVLYGSVALTGSDYLISRFFSEVKDSIWAPFLTGTISGIVSQIIVSPVDLIKTRVMADFAHNKGMMYHGALAFKEGRLTHGMTARVLRYGPGAGFMIGLNQFYEGLITRSSQDLLY